MSSRNKHIDKSEALALFSQGDESVLENLKDLHNIDVYREMVQKNFHLHLSKSFGLSKAAIQGTKWESLVNDFIQHGQPKSKLFWQMPGEFLEFASAKIEHWQADLMKFEWSQVQLYFAPDYNRKGTKPFSYHPSHIAELHDEWSILNFEYPVYKIKWEDLEQHKGNYFLLQFRNQNTFEIENIELNIFLKELMLNLSTQQFNLAQTLTETLTKFNTSISPQINEQYQNFIHLLTQKNIIVGLL